MKVSAVIRKNETKELKIKDMDFTDGYGFDALEYIFLEGNYSCDCNLDTFFDPDSDREVSCYAEPGKKLYTVMSIYSDGLPVFVRISDLNDENVKETIVTKGNC